MQSIEIDPSPDKEKPIKPETIFDKRVEGFINSADDYAILFTKLEYSEQDPDKKADYKDKIRKYDAVSQILFETTRDEKVWTVDSLCSSINKKREVVEQSLIKFPKSKTLSRQLDDIDLTLAHIDGFKPVKGREDQDMNAIRANRVFKSDDAFKLFRKSIETGETYSPQDAKKEIEKIYRLLCKTESANNLELKYDTLNEKLEHIQAIGQDAVRQYVIDMISHYDKQKGSELSIEDISTLRLAFVTFKDGSEIRGRSITRPVFIIEDDNQRKRITGDEVNGFMSSNGFSHLLPESGLDDLPIIVSRNNIYTIKHEITHSMDIKCVRGDRDQGYNSVLSEAIANYASKDFRSGKGWIVGQSQKTYFDRYSEDTDDKISFEDFNQIISGVETAISGLEASGFDKQTILKTMMVCGTVQDFITISNGLRLDNKVG